MMGDPEVLWHEVWPAAGSADTELSVMMEPEVCHGEAKVYAGVVAATSIIWTIG